jgi:transposase
MQGRHTYQPQLFSTIKIEALIPQNHILRKIDRALDLSFVRELTQDLYCQNNGRPSIDPELFLRMLLVGYLNGITSDRQLCEEVGFNLAYRWFCRLSMEDTVPEHSSLTRIRDRFGEKVFEEIFQKVVRVCIEKGLVKGDSVMTDGSLIRANASLDSLKQKDGTDKDSDDEPPTSGINKIRRQRISNETHMSKSDPDCTLAGKAHQAKNLYYKAHHTIDRSSRVVVDAHITTGGVHETTQFLPRLEAIEKNFGFKIEESIADRGYGAGENILSLKQKGVRSIIPLYTERAEKKTNKIKQAGFVFDRKNDRYICPEGHALTPKKLIDNQRIYTLSRSLCIKCPRFSECVSEAENRNNRAKRIVRNIYQELYEWVLRREKTSLFQRIYSERMWKMEGIWAEAKNEHGLGRAKYRGRSKMQIQAYLTASVQNLKRLAAFTLWYLTALYRVSLKIWSGEVLVQKFVLDLVIL